MDTTRLKRKTFPATALVNLMLCIGLFLIVCGLLTDKPLLALGAICAPLCLFIVGYGFVKPRFIFFLYITYAYFFVCVMRYFQISKLSFGLDILLIYMVCALILSVLNRKKEFDISQTVNGLTFFYSIWVLYILIQILNPGTEEFGITHAFRILIFCNLAIYISLSLLLNTPKVLHYFLICWGCFTIIAFIKLMYQKYVGFDLGERIFLHQGGERTHILVTGIRYFSIFTDAGNFGPHMGAVAVIYSIACIYIKNNWLKIFFAVVAIMGLIGMFLSGTRSAIAVPFGGLVLYCLLCKNIKIFTSVAVIGLLSFSFLAFTNIGDSNRFIHRMRTAMQPKEDASFNTRLTNREMISEHMKDKPWGIGIEKSIPMLWSKPDGSYREGILPPDSYFVDIWIQYGIIGLIIHIIMYSGILLWGSYLVLFRLNNFYLRQILAIFLGAVLGFLINGYAGQCIEQPPTNIFIYSLLAFVMNGPYIDKQLSKENNNYIL